MNAAEQSSCISAFLTSFSSASQIIWGQFLPPSQCLEFEQVAQNWPMRLNFETLVGTIREVKLSVDRMKVTRSFPGPPGGEGLPNNEANSEER